MKRALITGSCGLVGSACTRLLCSQGWTVWGFDSDMRRQFFGPQASTAPLAEELKQQFPYGYVHAAIDIRQREEVRARIKTLNPDLIIHTAAQPSHDYAATVPFDDFDINAVGTLNLLEAARRVCPESPFVYVSTNKVYGDRPNWRPMMELRTRWEYTTEGDINESVPVDQCLHSLFGASKLAGDVLVQEYGRYFGMPTGIFRGGCLTGSAHAAVESHGFLNYIVKCTVQEKPYTVYGYKGKQVRDQLHADDAANLFLRFFDHPRCGEVYNAGGGRMNSCSILEVLEVLNNQNWTYVDQPRKGDHICYISDLSKIQRHFPGWAPCRSLPSIIDEIAEHYGKEKACLASV